MIITDNLTEAKKKVEKKEIRPKPRDPSYLDLDTIGESPIAVTLAEKLERRQDAKELENAAVAARKAIDAELIQLFEDYEVEGILNKDTLTQRVVSRSAGKWDKTYLQRTLKPEQLEKAYTEGSAYEYVMFVDNPEAVEKIRDNR